jgi:hypothetical protein
MTHGQTIQGQTQNVKWHKVEQYKVKPQNVEYFKVNVKW